MCKIVKNTITFQLLFLLLVAVSNSVFAQDYSFSWTANPEPVEGYNLYYKVGGSTATKFEDIVGDEGPFSVNVGKVTNYTISGLLDNTTYHFALTAYNGGEEGDYTDVITVSSSGNGTTPLSATITVDKETGEAPLAVSFDGSASTGVISNYSWDFGDGGSDSGSIAEYTYQAAGSYTAVLTIEDSGGQTKEATVNINVAEPPQLNPPSADIVVSATSGEAPLVVIFNGSGSRSDAPPITSYNWSFGDNSSGTGEYAEHEYGQAGTYTATLTVEDSNGISEEVNTTITVTELVVLPVAAISASPVSGEAPLVVSFNGSGSISDASPITSYNWSFGDNSSGTGESIEHEYGQAGTYIATLSVENSNGISEEVSTTITVTEPIIPDPPVAVIVTSVTAGTAPLGLTLSGADSTGDIVSYSWGFGDNTTAGTGPTQTHSYTDPGSYTVTLTVVDSANQTSQTSVAVTVSEADPGGVSYSFSWTANPEPVEGYNLYYKVGGSTATTFEDIVADEGPFSVNVGKVTNYTISGLLDNTTYHFALTAYNGGEEGDYTDVITVSSSGNDTTPLSATITVDKETGEAPLAVSFDGSASTGVISNYSWDFGDGGSDSGSIAEYTYQAAGSYTAVLTIEDSGGQTKEATVNINVAEPPQLNPPSADIVVSATSGEAPLVVIFNGSGSRSDAPPITSYNWSFGDNSSGTGEYAEHEYGQAGTYTATLTVEDSNGISEEVNTTITVTELVVLPVAAISASPVSGEAPLVVSFNGSGSISDASPITSYNWSFGDNSSGTGESIEHEYGQAGTYIATLSVENSNGISEEVSTTITVTEPIIPDPPVAVIVTSVTAGTAPLGLTLSGADSTGDIVSYSWGFGDNTTAGTGPTQTHSYTDPGSYTVTLTVVDSANQTSQTSVAVTVSEADPGGVSYSFSWTANPEPVEGYNLYYKVGGSTATTFEDIVADEGPFSVNVGKVTNYTISGLLDNTTYHFALTAYNGGEEGDYTDVITVSSSGNDTTPLSATITVDKETGEAPLAVSFDASGSTGLINSYSWNFGDGDAATGSVIYHNYASPGNYTATLTVVDDIGNSQQDSTVISVSEPVSSQPSPPVASIEVSSTEGTVPFTVGFEGETSTSSNGSTIDSYEWDFGDGSEKNYGVNVQHIFNQSGTFMVVLKVTDSNGYSDEINTFITVNSATSDDNSGPNALFTESVTVGAVPLTVVFDASSSTDPDVDNLSYSWSFGDGGSTSDVVAEHSFTSTGSFDVVLTVKDVHGATSEATKTITVLTDSEYKKYLRGKKIGNLIIIYSLLLGEE